MIWQGFPEFFTTISFAQQQAVHTYYCPSKILTDEELLAHRRALIAQDRQLPARAGKAFRQLETIYRLTSAQAKGDPERWRQLLNEHRHGVVGPPDRKGRRWKISGLARAEINTRMLARALVRSADEEDHRAARKSTSAATNPDFTASLDTPSSEPIERKDRPAA